MILSKAKIWKRETVISFNEAVIKMYYLWGISLKTSAVDSAWNKHKMRSSMFLKVQ